MRLLGWLSDKGVLVVVASMMLTACVAIHKTHAQRLVQNSMKYSPKTAKTHIFLMMRAECSHLLVLD